MSPTPEDLARLERQGDEELPDCIRERRQQTAEEMAASRPISLEDFSKQCLDIDLARITRDLERAEAACNPKNRPAAPPATLRGETPTIVILDDISLEGDIVDQAVEAREAAVAREAIVQDPHLLERGYQAAAEAAEIRARLRDQQAAYETDPDVVALQQAIERLQRQLAEKQRDHDFSPEVAPLLHRATFLEARAEAILQDALAAGIRDQGTFRIKQPARRNVDPILFKRLFPEEFNALARIDTTAAEVAVGRKRLEGCITREYYGTPKIEYVSPRGTGTKKGGRR